MTARRAVKVWIAAQEVWLVVFLRDLRPIVDPIAWTDRDHAEIWAGLVDAEGNDERKLEALAAYAAFVRDLTDEEHEAVSLQVERELAASRRMDA
jgi:hypothetical protein